MEVNFSPRLAFDRPTYYVDERSGNAVLTVRRLNDGMGAISVNYATLAGTATAGSDYTTTSGSLTWAAADFTSRTISVPIVADGVAEGAGSEAFKVRLSSPSGATLPSGTDANVIIHDAGTSDPSFVPPFLTSAVSATVVEPEGNLVIGGFFLASDPLTVNGIARLFSDGSHDASFDKAAGANPLPITSMVRQADGKLIVIGAFTALRGIARNHIARLNADGSLDTSFVIGTGPDAALHAIVVQPDGKVLVGGDFTTWNGSAMSALVRLNGDGSVDASFGAFTSVVSPIAGLLTVSALALQPTAAAPHFSILAGGLFQRSPSGNNLRSGIVRLLATGALDSSFDAVKGAHAAGVSNSLRQVSSIAVQQDGKIIVGGQFTGFNGTNANRLARLNSDGTNDAAFITAMGTALASGDVTSLWPLADGKVIIGGNFATASGLARKGLARYSSTGVVDAEFKSTIGAATGVNSIAMQPDGSLIAGLNGFTPDALIRVFTGQSSLPGVLSFSAASSSGVEGGNATVLVQRTGGSSGAISVNYITRATGAAIADIDYATRSGTLVWANGDTATKAIDLPLLTDAITEADETFTVVLGVPIGGTLLGAQATTSVTIIGGDTSTFPHANFATATSALSEGQASPSVTVTVNLSAPAGQAVAIPLIFSGAATLGTDYTSSTSTLNFSATDTTQTFTLTVLDDSTLDALLETAIITLGSPNGPALLGPSITHTLSLTDNELIAHIDTPPASQTVALGGSATFTVVASGVPAPTYQWKKNNVVIPGATGGSYTLSPTLLTSMGTFKVDVTNHGITQTSTNAELAVADAAPKALVQATGTTLKLTLSAAGNMLSYQWFKGATPLADSPGTSPRITGATTKILSIKTLTLADATTAADTYHCIVSSGLGAPPFTALPTTLQVTDTIPDVTGPATLPAAIVGGSYDGNNAFITVDTSVNRTPATYSATGLPTGLSVVPATGKIIGRPTLHHRAHALQAHPQGHQQQRHRQLHLQHHR